jgi:plasmid segregation protein ParM
MSKNQAVKKHVLGLDIGYSNVKIAFGDGTKSLPTTIVRPAQAAPLEQVDGGLEGNKDAFCVQIDGRPWLAFVNPGSSVVPRSLHSDYTSSDAYLALFYASLLTACPDGQAVDHLVTGLPVGHYYTEGVIEDLVKRMTGVHQVSDKVSIEVKKVTVLAQPAGTMIDIYSNHEDADMFMEAMVLVLDPGFFSVDWVVFSSGVLKKDSSSNNLEAMSAMIVAINNEIRLEYGGVGAGIDRIENALQAGKSEIVAYSKRIQLQPFIERAKLKVAGDSLAKLRTEMRFMGNQSLDFILLAGGGASFYKDEIQKLYPGSRIIQADNTVISNARGFWLHGIDH